MYPPSLPSPGCFSTLTLTSASSPNTDFAYRLAARKPHSPSSADRGVRHRMLVLATMWSRNERTSPIWVLTATLFSHSNSAHMLRKATSAQLAGLM